MISCVPGIPVGCLAVIEIIEAEGEIAPTHDYQGRPTGFPQQGKFAKGQVVTCDAKCITFVDEVP